VANVLHDFIVANREEIIALCRVKVTARTGQPAARVEVDHGVPVFLDQLLTVLRCGLLTSPEIGATAMLHGRDLLRQGFSVSEVVYDYGDRNKHARVSLDSHGSSGGGGDGAKR
jgi:hypothetical protein